MMPQIKSPQVEEGYTRIANELLEAMATFGFTAHQWAVMMALIRKTYGYQKTHDDISASQLSEVCGVPRNHVSTALKKLYDMHVITKKPGKYGLILGINKDYSMWNKDGSANQNTFCDASTSPDSGLALVKPILSLVATNDAPASTDSVPPSPDAGLPELVQILDTTSPDSGQVASTDSGHTKENLPKENQQKKVRARKSEKTLTAWLADCKQLSEKPIPEDDPVFDYANGLDLPIDFIRYAWVEFKRKYGDNDKKQKDWRAHFRNAVKENWYGIWFDKAGQWELTTRGKQIQKETREKA